MSSVIANFPNCLFCYIHLLFFSRFSRFNFRRFSLWTTNFKLPGETFFTFQWKNFQKYMVAVTSTPAKADRSLIETKKKSRTLFSSKFTSCLIDSAQEIDLIRNSPSETQSSVWWEPEGYKRFRSESKFISLTAFFFFYKHHWPCTEDDRELMSTHPPLPQSAAHLAGFMGKELTSGRLPCYPSSVWKLIPSSVSKPRDPSAGDLTWVSAVCVTPTLLSPLVRENLDALDVCETQTPSAGGWLASDLSP